MDERGIAPPRRPDERTKGDSVGLVLLSPPDESRVERNVEQCVAAGHDESAAFDPRVGALVERLLLPPSPSENGVGALVGEPVDLAMRDRPPRPVLNRLHGISKPFGEAVSIGEHRNVRGAPLNGGHDCGGLHPRLRA